MNDYFHLDLILERLDQRMLDRILLVIQFQTQVNWWTHSVHFGAANLCPYLARSLLDGSYNGIASFSFKVLVAHKQPRLISY